MRASRNVQRVRYVTARDFDEQMWPINAMLFIFACCVAAVVVTAGIKHDRFVNPLTDPERVTNAWFHLGILGGTLLILVLGTMAMRHRVATRRMQLAVLLALLVEFFVGIGLYMFPGPEPREAKASNWVTQRREAVTLPQYGPQAHNEIVEDPITSPATVSAADPAAQPQARPTRPQPLAKTQSSSEPSSAERRMLQEKIERAAATPARHSARPGGKISRSETADRVAPNPQVTMPKVRAVAENAQPQLTAQATPVEQPRTTTAQVERRPNSQPSTRAEEPRPLSQMPRRTESQQLELNSRVAAQPRRSTPRNEPAVNAAQANAPRTVQSSQPNQPEARPTSVAANPSAPQTLDRRPQSGPRTTQQANLAQSTPRRATRSEQGAPSQRSPQMIARSTSQADPTQAVAATQADVRTAQTGPTASRPQASAQLASQRDSSGSSNLAARATTSDSPSAPQTSQTLASVTLRRRQTSNTPRVGATSARPTVARSPRVSLAAGGSTPTEGSAMGADVPPIAAIAGPGIGGVKSDNREGIAGVAPRGSGSANDQGQSVTAPLGNRNTDGGPTGSSESAIRAAAANSLARAGSQGAPQVGGTSRRLGKLARSQGDGPGMNPTADVPVGPSGGGNAGGNDGPEVRVASSTSGRDGPTAGGTFGRGQADDGGPVSAAESAGPSGSARRASEGSQTGPVVAQAGLRRINRGSSGDDLPGGADLADVPGPMGGPRVAQNTGGNLGPPASEATRGETNSLIVKAIADRGPGGVKDDPDGELGLRNRAAREESDVVQPDPRRFDLRKTNSGDLAANVKVDNIPAFSDRDPKVRALVAPSRDGASNETEKAVAEGLEFLARHQSRDGRWSLHFFAQGKNYRLPRKEELVANDRYGGGYKPMHSDTAATGLALLAFLGAGYTHQGDEKYRDVVEAALRYLVENQKSNGDLYSGRARYVWLYSHGIAAIALCEAYGMTQDPQLRDPAQRALDFIVYAQSEQGGWRYAPKVGSDTSVSGWQVMALKSGQLAGLKVPEECFRKVTRWLDYAHPAGDKSKYIYRPDAAKEHQNTASPTMTAEGLLMRLYLGWGPDHPDVLRGSDYLLKNPPAYHGGARNSYYWYYATHLLIHVKGDRWKQWNERLKKLLVSTQETQGPLRGSWDPWGETPDYWGSISGRIYTTAMHVLMLEVYYRRLPLYRGEATADRGAAPPLR